MANWLTTKGFDFRDSLAAVDSNGSTEAGHNRVFVYNTAQTVSNGSIVTDPGGLYPTTRTVGGDSITYGWVTDIPTTRDRNSGNDERLVGIHFAPGSANVLNFRVDLPAAGSYKVRLAIGDNDGAHSPMHVLILDNTTTVLTRNEGTTAGNSYIDAAGTERTETNWVSSNAQSGILTFATTTLFMRLDASVDLTTIAHLEIEQVTSASAALTGTATASITEADIVAGGKTIVITLTGDTFIPS
jgi:hypothetical protein